MPFLFLSLYDYTLYTTDTEPMILYQEDYKNLFMVKKPLSSLGWIK